MMPATRNVVVLVIKALIAVVSVWFILQKVTSRNDFENMLNTLQQSVDDSHKNKLLLLVLVLMAVNWLLETAKWKLLLERISTAGWWLCIRSVMSGVTVSMFTPNRVGEFAGRVLHLDAGIRVKGALASIIGSMNQLLITVVAGGIGLILSMENYVSGHLLARVLMFVVFVLIMVLIYVYFRIPGLTKLAEKFAIFRKLKLYTSVFEKYTSIMLLKLSVLSATRYLVFTFQFILVLSWLNVNLSWEEAMRALSLMYLVLAVVPTIAISELTVRGSVALFFFADYAGNSSGILAASSLIWFINLVIPALLGAVASFYFRFNKS